MPEIIKDFEQIDVFLTVAKTIDTFQQCNTVYDLFGIKNKSASYTDIERNIDEFVNKYAGTNAPKFKIFGKTLSAEAERIKRVLKDHQREYNDYLRENDPRAKQIRDKFNFCTKRDGRLDSEEKNGLIEEGKEAGLTETEVRALIAQWVIETGVREVEARSGDETSGKSFSDFGGKTFYEILGVADDAEYAEIKAAYEREHVKYTTSREKAKASARFFVVSEAWDCLKDPVKRREYDEKLKQPKTDAGTGKPRLVVECKIDYTFRDIRRGAVINVDKIVIKNPDGGLLQGTIKSDVPWLQPDRNKILEKHEQELYINILTSKIPVNTYDTKGTITIDTNGGPPYLISFRVILEGLEIAAERFRKTYVPLIAACAGFIGSFGHSPFKDFLAGAFFAGIITYAFAKLFVKFFLNKGIDIFKLPPVLIKVAAAGVVILTITSHSGRSSLVKMASYAPAPAPAPSRGEAQAPAPPPSNAQVRITRSVIAMAVGSDNQPLGEGSVFAQDTLNGKLVYYVSYDGAISNQTKFRANWYRDGNPIGIGDDYTIPSVSGNFYNTFNYSFTPGNYEARLIIDGNEVDKTSFTVSASSAATQKEEYAPPPPPPPPPSNAQIRITRSVIARGVGSDNQPLGVGSAFPENTLMTGKLVYYVNYDGAISNRTKFRANWYRDGNPIANGNNYTIQYVSGNFYNTLNYRFAPGNYEARLIVDGIEVDRTSFTVNANSGDMRMADEQRRHELPPPPPPPPYPGAQRSNGWEKSRENTTYEDN